MNLQLGRWKIINNIWLKKCCHYQLEKTSLWYWQSWLILQRKTKLDFQSTCKVKTIIFIKIKCFCLQNYTVGKVDGQVVEKMKLRKPEIELRWMLGKASGRYHHQYHNVQGVPTGIYLRMLHKWLTGMWGKAEKSNKYKQRATLHT